MIINTDYHCHILPKIDDGSVSVQMTSDMLSTLSSQGISKVYATPHFDPHEDNDIDLFLENRNNAFESIKSVIPDGLEIVLSAEVAIEKYRERFVPIGMYENKLYAGMEEALQRLKESGKVLIVATSKPEKFAVTILKHFGIGT